MVCVSTVRQLMSGLDHWAMDVFKLAEVTNGRPLTAIAFTIFQVDNAFSYLLKLPT